MTTMPSIPWRVFDAKGAFKGLVFAPNAVEALRQLPAGHSVYIGGPSAEYPLRPWWIDAWNSEAVHPDDLIANDPRDEQDARSPRADSHS
jgi:hypothetical protein